MYRVGQMRHRVTFETRTTTPNAMGDPVKAYTPAFTAYARVESLAGKERFASQVVQNEAEFRIVTRYNPALASVGPDDRATFDGRAFDIRSVVDVDERRKELVFYCTEHVGYDAA